jgi:phosphoglycerate dehydrogenase-like enzyme
MTTTISRFDRPLAFALATKAVKLDDYRETRSLPFHAMVRRMTDTPVSRRDFLASGAALAAAANATDQTRQPAVSPDPNQPPARQANTPIRLLTTTAFEPHEIKKIESAAPNVQLIVEKDQNEFRKRLPEAEVVYGSLTGSDLASASKVKWVQTNNAGVENQDAEFMASPIVLTNMARVFAPAITETGMGMLLCLTRGITTYYMPQFAKRQMKPVGAVKSADHVELGRKTMGIVGLGGMGSSLARRACYGFDMRVVATDAKPLSKPEYVAELHDPSWFRTMVPQVDVLVAAAPHTKLTERMFNESVFRKMKKSAYFLALSRGMLFDDQALVKALQGGWIAGAGLDVFPQEPPPSTHPIFDCTNVAMTAHTSGWSPDRQVRLVDLFAENVRRYSIGAPLMNVVDKKAGY